MIRDLLSRLCAGLRTPKWLNLPLLIAMLMPLCTHAAALPDGAPDYEFSVDNVTYKEASTFITHVERLLYGIKVHANMDELRSKIDEPDFQFGIAEKDKFGETTGRYAPFDANGDAFLPCEIRIWIGDYLHIENESSYSLCRIHEDIENRPFSIFGIDCPQANEVEWECPFYMDSNKKMEFDFESLYTEGILKESDKVGVRLEEWLLDIDKFGHNVVFEDLLLNYGYWVNLIFEIDGVEYVSEDYVKHTATPTIEYSYETGTNSLNIDFDISGYDSSLGDVVFSKLEIYKGSVDKVDAEVEHLDDMALRFPDLEAGQSYELKAYLRYNRKSDGQWSGLGVQKILFVTETPTWIEGQAQALNTKKARLTYTTNIDDACEAFIEWRRVDAPDVVKSTTVACPVVDGQLVGILNNLNPDVYYKFRPIYEQSNGRTYSGEWIGIFTGDANVWFDPEISTRPARVRNDGTVTLQGSVIPGSGDISEQGFEVWPNSGAQHAPGSGEESSHTFIKCNGISISTELTDLKHGVTYTYRAYAKVDGQMYTGPEETFMIPGESGIEDTVGDAEAPTIIGYYNLQGLRSDRPFRGMNIVVYSNGKTEKRIIRE